MADGVTVTMVLSLKAEAFAGFCAELPEMLKETRAFAGFRDIRVLLHRDRPGEIILIEEWDTTEAYEAYVAYRTETGVMDRMAAMISAPPRLDYWQQRIA